MGLNYLQGLDYEDADEWFIIDIDDKLSPIPKGNIIPKLGRTVFGDDTKKYCIFHSIGKNRGNMYLAISRYLKPDTE
jgi:hypothetical protein